MNLDENLRNAVKVLRETYYSIDKLANFLRAKAPDFGFNCITNDILLWQSKSNVWGWLTSKFTLLFQHIDRRPLENGYVDDDIFGIEISFEDDPSLYITRFHYAAGVGKWSARCKPTDEWGFTHPKWNKSKFDIIEKDGLIISKPLRAKVSDAHWGLTYALYKGDSFSDITSDNVEKKIFAVMNKLAQYKVD